MVESLDFDGEAVTLVKETLAVYCWSVDSVEPSV
jgi:hypothetical protein